MQLVGSIVTQSYCRLPYNRRVPPMKPLCLLLFAMLLATASLANTRNWKAARIVDSSETDVSGEARADKNTIHYTVETEDRLYFLDYTYKPNHRGNNRPPTLAVNVYTKIAIEGKHAYVLDATGGEVKLQIVKKPPAK